MLFYLSKLLPLFVYPLGMACVLLATALIVRRNPQWQTRLIAVTLALLWLGGNRIVAMTLVRSLEWRYAPPPGAASEIPQADAIVVLGGATRTPGYPRPTAEVNEAGDRLLYAAWLYEQGAAPVIVLSGGAAPWLGPDGPSEAEIMAGLLQRMGVPQSAMLLETDSVNTYENAESSLDIFKTHNIESLILVTSAIHMPRAYATFDYPGIDVTPIPTDFWISQAEWDYYLQPRLSIQLMNLLPSSRDLALTTQAIKEYIGIVVYAVRGWL
ncbi:MAG: YdcF family protein [Anaerolineae bacterium]